MKARLALLVGSCCAIAASQVLAGSQTGKVKDVYVRDSDGLILVDLYGTASGHPACATQQYWIIPSESTDSGKRFLAMLIAAQLSGRTVAVRGKNTCSRWGDGEDIESIGLEDQ
jgi:hypothetical protein